MYVTDHKLPIANDLLSLSEIGHMTFIIDSPCEVPSTLFPIRPSGYDCICDAFGVCDSGCELLDIALNYGLTPACDGGLLVECH